MARLKTPDAIHTAQVGRFLSSFCKRHDELGGPTSIPLAHRMKRYIVQCSLLNRG